MLWLLLLAVFWIACGVLAYGFVFAHFQRKYPEMAEEYYRDDLVAALVGAPLGPVGLVCVAILGFYRHGLKFR